MWESGSCGLPRSLGCSVNFVPLGVFKVKNVAYFAVSCNFFFGMFLNGWFTITPYHTILFLWVGMEV